jgi:hypothetical protein
MVAKLGGACLLPALGAGALTGLPLAQATLFIDPGRRQIDVSNKIDRAFPAGPPALFALYAVPPRKCSAGAGRAPGPGHFCPHDMVVFRECQIDRARQHGQT